MELKYNNIIIKLSEIRTIGEVVEKLEELFPNGRWADFEVVYKQYSFPKTPLSLTEVVGKCCGNCKCQKSENTTYSIPYSGTVSNQNG